MSLAVTKGGTKTWLAQSRLGSVVVLHADTLSNEKAYSTTLSTFFRAVVKHNERLVHFGPAKSAVGARSVPVPRAGLCSIGTTQAVHAPYVELRSA